MDETRGFDTPLFGKLIGFAANCSHKSDFFVTTLSTGRICLVD
jgi:hypothetical protein